LVVGEVGFEVGDASVLEAEVGPGGLESFVEGAVVGGELADALFEGGVLGGDPLDGFLGPFGLQVADLAEEFTDPAALGLDFRVGGLERILGVQRAFTSGGFALLVLAGERAGAVLARLRHRGGDRGAGLGVVVEEGAGGVGAAGHRGGADAGLLSS
jgi:hypothetical protein